MSNANYDLYFISTIELAYASHDRRQSLARAFAIIRRAGCRPAYERGYRQFRLWMKAAAAHARLLPVSVPNADNGKAETVGFDVYINNDRSVRICLPLDGGNAPITDAPAGRYRIVSETGRILLDVTLASEDLAESSTPPGSLQKAAAADTATTEQPSQSFSCLDHRLRLDAFRGLGAGALRLTLAPPGALS